MSQEQSNLRTKRVQSLREHKRRRLTQQAIVEAAAELFARDGFGATSLDDIAEKLGASKASLYYHIKNKEEILRLIFLTVLTVSEEPLRRIVEITNLSPIDKLGRAIEHQTAVAADRSPAMIVFYREQPHLTGPFAKEIILRKKAYERYFEHIIEEGQVAGVFHPDVDPKIATFGLLGMCNWLSQWYRSSGQYSPQQISEMFIRMVENGLVYFPSPPES